MQSCKHITETVKYGMPCFCYHGKMMYYLWTDKKTGQPYVLFVEGDQIDHPSLVQGKRSRMKVLNIDPNQDLPLTTLKELMEISMTIFDEKLKLN